MRFIPESKLNYTVSIRDSWERNYKYSHILFIIQKIEASNKYLSLNQNYSSLF